MGKTSGRLLIVGAGGNQIALFRRAREMDIFTVAMDGSADAPGLPFGDVSEVADICSVEEIYRVAEAHRVDGIYPAAEWGVEAAFSAAHRLGLPGVPPEVATRTRNKHSLRMALDAAGVPNPRYCSAKTLDEATDAANDIGIPVIVKPVDGNASRGVMRLDYIEDMPLAFGQAYRASRSDCVLIEEFLEGEEFNVDGLMYEGQYRLGGITGKERSPAPLRFDLGIFMPPMLDTEALEAVVSCTEQALTAIGFASGTTHVEVILSDNGPHIVEIAARPGGGRIPTDLIPLTYGMDFVADAFRIALGRPPEETHVRERGTAVYWIPSRAGVITEITGIDEARALAGVEELHVYVKPGDTVTHIVDCVGRDRIGYVMTTGDTVQEAIATAKRAQEICCIHTRADT